MGATRTVWVPAVDICGIRVSLGVHSARTVQAFFAADT
jgi:hypothetical protein